MRGKTKALLIIVVSLILAAASTMTAFASDYTIYDGWWDCDFYEGTAIVRWDKCEKSTKYNVQIFRNAYGNEDAAKGKSVLKKTVSGDHLDASSIIAEKGKGSYYFTITPTSSKHQLDDMYIGQDVLDVDNSYLENIREHVSHSAEQINGWQQTPTGWKYLQNGSYVRNNWLFVNNFWYYFNGNGDMLKGWQWINGRCYYLNPVQGIGGYPEGACWMNGVTPDGYTVDASGAWTVNGYVQVK